MTERLYYTDSYQRDFHARVLDRSEDGLTVYLDRSAFYPASGGQPSDTGTIAGVPVLEVIDEGERVAHRTAAPLHTGPVDCSIDWDRRFDHMQQHSGQHLLSAVFHDLFGLQTVSFHLGQESSTIDLEGGTLEPRTVAEAEAHANQVAFENRPLAVLFQDSTEAEGLRKASARAGTLRIVTIEGLDRSACGGTHVRATGEIGPVLVRRLEKIRGSTRVEFLCGMRAVRRARADYDSLTRAAQNFSAQLDEVPGLVANAIEAGKDREKQLRKLQLEIAAYQGKELYGATAPREDGIRRVVRRQPSGNLEDLRAVAQSFTGQAKAVFLAVVENPPSVLLAASGDAGVDAGRLVKEAVTAAGGRGGGNARMAQGSVPKAELLEEVARKLT